MIKERATDELALRQTDHQLTGRGAPATNLHRPGAALPRELGVDHLDQVQLLSEIADHHQPAMPRQPRIIGPNLDPSDTPEIVHPHAPSG
jgi:hypothetical protein